MSLLMGACCCVPSGCWYRADPCTCNGGEREQYMTCDFAAANGLGIGSVYEDINNKCFEITQQIDVEPSSLISSVAEVFDNCDDCCNQPTVEACCHPDGSCTDELASTCQAAGGTPMGPGTSCATVTCDIPTESLCWLDWPQCHEQTCNTSTLLCEVSNISFSGSDFDGACWNNGAYTLDAIVFTANQGCTWSAHGPWPSEAEHLCTCATWGSCLLVICPNNGPIDTYACAAMLPDTVHFCGSTDTTCAVTYVVDCSRLMATCNDFDTCIITETREDAIGIMSAYLECDRGASLTETTWQAGVTLSARARIPHCAQMFASGGGTLVYEGCPTGQTFSISGSVFGSAPGTFTADMVFT